MIAGATGTGVGDGIAKGVGEGAIDTVGVGLELGVGEGVGVGETSGVGPGLGLGDSSGVGVADEAEISRWAAWPMVNPAMSIGATISGPRTRGIL